MKQTILVILVLFVLIKLLSGCTKVQGSKEGYTEVIKCIHGSGPFIVHEGFDGYWLGDFGTIVEYTNGEQYRYSVAVQCRYEKKKVSLEGEK